MKEAEIREQDRILTLDNVGLYFVQNLENNDPDGLGLLIQDNNGNIIIQAVLDEEVLEYFVMSIIDLLRRREDARSDAQGTESSG